MQTKIQSLYSSFAKAACLSLILGLTWSSPAQAHTTGRAFVAFVNAPTLGAGPLYLADTGELSPAGGWEGAGFLSAEVPGVLSANVLTAATMGTRDDVTGQANSSSSLADVVVLPGHAAQLTASFVRAQAGATDSGSQGSAEIHDLTFGGMSVAVTGLPNQRVEIPGLLGPIATLVINEQTVTSDATSQAITVNALHLTLATGEEVILASAKSFVKLPPPTGMTLARAASNGNCASNITHVTKATWLGGSAARPPIIPASVPAPSPPECIDFVTGGGFFLPPNSTRPGRVNFGFNAGPRSAQNPELKGHVNVVDHDGFHIKGVTVDTYTIFGGDPDHCRVFEGDAVVNGASGFRYRVGVCDYGEPGRFDFFGIDVSNGVGPVYSANNFRSTCPADKPFCGELDGGNIQLHKSKCAKPAAFEERKQTLLEEI
ncbi:MAG TPA: choice-of-anchor P family protein [Candidatus Binatia bacterium]|jgi:hypothetical protein|nr:choice-of-anchor P family protein [Candidatus Binatia bacterium]